MYRKVTQSERSRRRSIFGLAFCLGALLIFRPTIGLAQSAPGVTTLPGESAATRLYLPLVVTAPATTESNPPAAVPVDSHTMSDYELAALARARNEPPFVAPEISAAGPSTWSLVGQWGPITPWPFAFASAAVLPDGQILAWGGNNLLDFNGGTNTYAALWNPATGRFQSVNHTDHSMFCGIPVMLEDGRVLVTGGDGTRKRVSTFDYRTTQWQRVEDMKNGRWYPGTVALANGQVATALGDPGGAYPELWTPGKGWTLLGGATLQNAILDYPGYQKNWLPYVHLAPNGQLFHSGPTERMNWISLVGNGSVTAAGVTNLWYPKYAAVLMLDEGKLFVAGGAATNVTGSPSTEQAAIIDLTGPTPRFQPLASMTYARKFNNGVLLPNGEVMMIGGTTKGYEFSDWGSILTPEIWNPLTGAWRKVANLAVPRNYHSVALLLPDGRVWTGGGGLCDCSADHPDAQIYAPAYLFNADGSPAARPVITAAPDVVTYGRAVTITASPAITGFTLIKLSAVTHDLNSDLRALRVPFTETMSGHYTLTFHSNPNVLTPGYWMLFALNSRGTPSVAKIIQVTSGRPYIEPLDEQGHLVNAAITLRIDASDPDNDGLTFTAAGLPPGLLLDPVTGVITGVATAVGTYPVIVTVSDGLNQSTIRFTWLINQPAHYRYIKLVALTEVNGDPWSSAAEINLVDGNGALIPRTGWLLTADSEEQTALDGKAVNVMDGDLNTSWQSQPAANSPASPHWLQIDLGDAYQLSALRYLPRQGSVIDGAIADYQLYVSPDGRHWGLSASGRFAKGPQEQTVALVTAQPEFNVALGSLVTQSSTMADGAAQQAIDGNRDGTYANHSVAATQAETDAWWEIDLGQRYNLTAIRLWPRTDCCAESWQALHLLVSGSPFVTQRLAATQAQPAVSDFTLAGATETPVVVPVGRAGRYVRLQLDGVSALQIAEVEILANLTTPLPEPLQLLPPTPTPQSVNTMITYSTTVMGGAHPTFNWLFGDGSVESGYSVAPTVTHAFTQPGLYLVTLMAIDDQGEEVRTDFVQAIHRPLTPRPPVASTNLLYVPRAVGNSWLWVVNPDQDSVSAFDVVTNQKLAEIGVGQGPRTLALAPDGRLWVANQDAATLSILDPVTLTVVQTVALPAASQPYGVVFTPAGDHAYVTLAATGELLQLDPITGALTGWVAVGRQVRQLAINSDGSRLYLSRFITPPLPGEATATPQTLVNGVAHGGEVVVVDGATLAVQQTIVLQASTQPDSEHGGRGIPNYLGPAVIAPDGLTAWVSSKQDNIFRGLQRDGLNLTFDSTVRSITSRLDLVQGVEVTAARLDHDNAGIAVTGLFNRTGNYLFVALEGSRAVAVVDAYGARELLRIDVGRAPQGLALAPDDRLLYVHNVLDRTITVHDLRSLLTTGNDTVPTVATYQTVATERLAPPVLLGKQLFYDAKDPRLARDSYLSCAACHHEGGEDGRVWDLSGFGEGLRNTIELNGHAGMAQGPLHWSANFDEVQDFEGQIRTLAGGAGLLSDADFAATHDPLGAPKAGRSADLDALAAYVASLSRVPLSPYRALDGALTAAGAKGKFIFRTQQCVSCHGGFAFTDSAPNRLHDIGTIKVTSGQRLGAWLPGFDTPTLRNGWATAPYLHDGSAPTLVTAIQAHPDLILSDEDLATLLAYLQQIDGREPALDFANQAPVLDQPNRATGRVGDSVVLELQAGDADGDALRYRAYGLPAGLAINPQTGVISGALTAPGVYDVSISVSDGLTVSGRFFRWIVEP